MGLRLQSGEISIHALREEGDLADYLGLPTKVISIHALREEGDPAVQRIQRAKNNFYPRPPRGGRPGQHGGTLCYHHISIHALREEGDLIAMSM